MTINKFLNVYNFVPFSGSEKSKYNEEEEQTEYTGSIVYTITTKTPIFIPDTDTCEDDELCIGHKIYDFFKYPDNADPVIPGSEIRGMVRSIYEAITNSCMGIFNAEIRPVKRTGEVFKPGLIKKIGNKYGIYEAKNYLYGSDRTEWNKENYSHYKEGQPIYFSNRNVNGRRHNIINKFSTVGSDVDLITGYIMKGEKGPKKKYTHVFVMKNNNESAPVITYSLDELKTGMDCVIDSYQEQPHNENAYKDYAKRFEEFCEGELEQEYFPVYYSEINGENSSRFVYISPAAITKEISNRSIGDIANGYLPCNDVKNCCPACRLFGMVGNDNENSLVSKIRFADAYLNLESDGVYCAPVILPELSSPKLGNVEFYLKRQNNKYKFWTYDYCVDDKENIIVDNYSPELRGRKFYLNQPNVVEKELSQKFWMNNPNCNNAKSNRNRTITPVKENVSFEGIMYFENITKKQLEQLTWIMNCGSGCDDEKDIVYKLGAAKPLGLGSVKMTIIKIQTRSVSCDDGQLIYKVKSEEKSEFLKQYDDVGFDHNDSVKKSFMNLMAFEKYRESEIAYPILENQIEYERGYEWFVENHKKDGRSTTGGRNKNYINRILPAAKDMNKLPKML